MPEPGFRDRGFNNPTAGRRKPRRRTGKRLKFPGEYAEFRLKDGRYLGEVMGDSFFGPETGAQGGRPITDSERQRIRDGNYPLAGMFRDDPQFKPRSETAAGIPARGGEVLAPTVGKIASPDWIDPNVQAPSPPLPPTGGVRQNETGEQAMPRETDHWLDGADLGPVSGGQAQVDGPAYLMPGQARFHDGETDALDRIGGAASLAVSGLFEGPYGIAHEDLGPLVNQSREDTLTPLFGTIRGLNEVLIEGGTQLGDLALRTATAPIIGGAVAVGQALIELGTTKTTARRIMRDIIAFADSQMGSPSGGAARLGAAVRKGKKPNDFRPVETTLLFDDAERSGVLVTFLDQIPPGERSAFKEALRQSYINGREVAETEVRRRGLGQVLSRLGGALAELELKKFEGQWDDRTKPIKPNRIYGPTFSNLSPKAKRHVKPATNSAMGAAGERHGFDLAKKMDPQARREVTVETPPQFAKNRRYDFVGRRWSDQVMEEVLALYDWLRGSKGRRYRALPVHSEAKTGAPGLSAHQRKVDAEAKANPGSFGDPPVTSVSTPRIFDHQIPLKKAFKVVESRMVKLVEKGHIDEATKEALLSAMISMREGGKKTITLADYADLYMKFVPAAVANRTVEGPYSASSEDD